MESNIEDYLIEEGYLSKNDAGYLCVEKKMEIGLLKLLYEYHCCPVLAFGVYGQELLEEMATKDWLEADNHLLSVEERNYFDYYMYNSPFTNGPALRNRYVHGTNSNPNLDYKHRSAYNRLLILLILELLKIEDDLIQRQMSGVVAENEDYKEETFLLGKMAEVLSYSNPKALTSAGKHVLLPKKLGVDEGYVFVNAMVSTNTPAYVLMVKEKVLPEYIAFLLNSSLFRYLLNKQGDKTAILTIERIRSISLPYSRIECQTACGRFERLIAQLKIRETALTREERLQLNLFSNLRDYLCIELFKPDFTKDTGIAFLAPFVELMEEISGDEKQCAGKIADVLLKPGNLMMDNMKKARIVLNKMNQA